MGKYFGTDGIRGVANQHPMTPEFAVKVGRATAFLFREKGKKSKIIVGKDTRLSGDMLVSALVSGICSMGVDVASVGILPTPGVAYLTASECACAGIVISASHNPFYDNGIKLFDGYGFKVSEDQETAIEKLLDDDRILKDSASTSETGQDQLTADAQTRYKNFLLSTVNSLSIKGLKLAIDCSNGATFQLAPDIFSKLGAEILPLFTSPDGKNINEGCGSEHPEILVDTVKKNQADIGLAFDGDGDRLVTIDEKGNVLTGDQLLAVFARDMQQNNKLKNHTLVSTIMSNIGLGLALQEMGIQHVTSDVGDRYVMEKMRQTGAVLGGENSGHLLFLNHHTTGDGLLSALQLLRIMIETNQPLSELSRVLTVFPQTLINVEVREKPEIDSVAAIKEKIQSVEKNLAEKGRVLVRYSGTQPVCRVMVEGSDKETTDRYCREIADVVLRELGCFAGL